MPFAETSTGARLHYIDTGGRKTPVLVCHGLVGTASIDMGTVIDWLKADYRVIGLTFRGYGYSEPKPKTFPPAFYDIDAKDLVAFIDAIGLPKCHLIGYSDGGEAAFNLCVTGETKYKDVDLTVSFKAIKGDTDQGGGLIWRYRDANNYYLCRMNPLESNFRVYKVADGKRTQLATSDVKIPLNQWHELRVIHEGKRIRCFLDNTLRLEVEDATLGDAGNVGLWTKADAVTHFDDLRIAKPGE